MSKSSSKARHPHKLPWNAWAGAGGALLLFFGSQLIAGFMVALYPALKHWPRGRAELWLNSALTAQLTYLLLANAIILGVLYWFLKAHGSGFKTLGFRRPKWIDPLYVLAALPVYVLLFGVSVIVLKALMPGLDINQAQDVGFNGFYHGFQLVAIGLALIAAAPLIEEVIFRGMMYTSLRQRLPAASAGIIVSLLFAAGHLPEGGAAGLLYIAAIDTFILSLVLVYLREKTGALWAPIGLHALKNAIAFVSLFVIHTH